MRFATQRTTVRKRAISVLPHSAPPSARGVALATRLHDASYKGTSYVDNVSLTWEEFYSLLKSARRLPSTASAPPGAFLDAFREAYQRGSREVLCIVTSSQFTATHNAASDGAALAREQMPDLTVKVIDSRSAAAALGFVVLAAARSAANGATLEQAASKAEALIKGAYSVRGDELVLETRLYDVINRRLLTGRRYVGKVGDQRRMAHAFADLQLASLVAIIDPDNAGSIAVARKLGMRFEQADQRSDGVVRHVYRIHSSLKGGSRATSGCHTRFRP